MREGRYFHSIYDTASRAITHVDAALRFYSEDELASRSEFRMMGNDDHCQPLVEELGGTRPSRALEEEPAAAHMPCS